MNNNEAFGWHSVFELGNIRNHEDVDNIYNSSFGNAYGSSYGSYYDYS